jgi:2-oxoglutarate dehydrogenase E2 component (dihydrolipoamide succinyltransferase)
MVTEIKVPVTGYEMTVAKVIEWHKKEGDHIEEGEPLVTVETQKSVIEMPAPCSGTLRKIIAPKDAIVKETDTIGLMAAPDEDIDHLLTEISLGTETPQSPGNHTPETHVEESSLGKEETIPLTGARKQMAEHMLRSKAVSAHGTTFNEADVSKALHLVNESNKEISFTSLLVKAAVPALEEFPLLNASSTEEKIIVRKYYHIGVAVNTDRGLFVPVIKDANKKDLPEITKDIRRLTLRAEEGSLSLDETQGGTFTISNGGRFGSLFFVPIINQPQSAILGTGTIVQRPVAVDGQIVIKPMMYICVSYDHRIIPGAMAQQFLTRVRKEIEAY